MKICSCKIDVLLALLLLLMMVHILSHTANAQETQTKEVTEATELKSTSTEFDPEKVSLSEELEELALVIQEKSKALKSLKSKLGKDGSNPELELEVAVATHQLDTLKKSFEQLAIGGIDLDVFGVEEQPKTWQEELTLVVKPLLENLRSLTERPRRRENLRQIIDIQKGTVVQAEKALLSIEKLVENKPSESQLKLLKITKEKWSRTREDAERQQQLALYQLNSLSGENTHWLTSLKESVIDFFQERGLTLLLAILVSIAIWLLLAGLRKLIDRSGKPTSKYVNRTTYRIVAYAQKLLTIILIIVGIITVFFIRGDILLLVITLALLFAGALGLKTLLPQFIAESRLLLNVGGVREHEQVIVDGVPWRVASINVFSKFSNPEIQGILRLPLNALKGLNSRPVKEEKWFPSSIGDWVLDGDHNLYEVIRQTPVVVELQSAQGTNKLVPTANYFSAGFVNLTKSKQIRITNRFGVGYELQNIALDKVPETFQSFVKTHLENANLETTQIEVRVEFEKAGESSLDYIVIALLGSKASRHFYRIERTIQQACVHACNDQGWSIPFPQLTIHQGSTDAPKT